eukprot:1177640-Prorocentrum_minimum.AAC.2
MRTHVTMVPRFRGFEGARVWVAAHRGDGFPRGAESVVLVLEQHRLHGHLGEKGPLLEGQEALSVGGGALGEDEHARCLGVGEACHHAGGVARHGGVTVHRVVRVAPDEHGAHGLADAPHHGDLRDARVRHEGGVVRGHEVQDVPLRPTAR